jgi:hypothetical protein
VTIDAPRRTLGTLTLAATTLALAGLLVVVPGLRPGVRAGPVPGPTTLQPSALHWLTLGLAGVMREREPMEGMRYLTGLARFGRRPA